MAAATAVVPRVASISGHKHLGTPKLMWLRAGMSEHKRLGIAF